VHTGNNPRYHWPSLVYDLLLPLPRRTLRATLDEWSRAALGVSLADAIFPWLWHWDDRGYDAQWPAFCRAAVHPRLCSGLPLLACLQRAAAPTDEMGRVRVRSRSWRVRRTDRSGQHDLERGWKGERHRRASL